MTAAAGEPGLSPGRSETVEIDRLKVLISKDSTFVTSPPARVDDSAEGLIVTLADGREVHLDPACRNGADSTFATAGELLRSARRVADWQACLAPGLPALMNEGTYLHPDPPSERHRAGADGLLMIKPGMELTRELLETLEQRFAEGGYRIQEARVLAPDELQERSLAARHYSVHFDIATRGKLEADERVALLRLYDCAEFTERYGKSADQVPVLPVYQFLQETSFSAGWVQAWSEELTNRLGLESGSLDGCNEVGEHKWITVFGHPDYRAGSPVFLINAHMLTVRARYEARGASCTVFHVLAHSPVAITWEHVRSHILGATDPALALPGSIRGDAFHDVVPLRTTDGRGVTRSYNGVHLSSGVVESLNEVSAWFDRPADDLPSANALQAEGFGSPAALVEKPYLDVLGRRHIVAELGRGKPPGRVAHLVSVGRLSSGESPCTPESEIPLLDSCVRAARTMTDDEDVLAVLGPYRAREPWARVRSLSPLVVLCTGSEGERRTWIDGDRGAVSVTRVGVDWLQRQVRPREVPLPVLTRHARLLQRIGIADVSGVAERIMADAIGQRPPRDWVQGELTAIRGFSPDASVARMAATYRRMARLYLSLHPLRAEAPCWYPADLRSAGAELFADALLKAHGVDPDLQNERSPRPVDTTSMHAVAAGRWFSDRGRPAEALFARRCDGAPIGFTGEEARLQREAAALVPSHLGLLERMAVCVELNLFEQLT